MNSTHSNKKLIVTGATGFIGQHLVPLLLKNGYQIVAIARNEAKAQKFDWFDKVEFVSADISKAADKIQNASEASLIHLAWSDLSNYYSLSHFESNLPQSYNFIRSCVANGVSHVLVAGTCLEYGIQNGPISSNAETLPTNPYAFAKDALHQKLKFLAREKPFCLQWARLFYTYGKGQNPWSVLAQLDTNIDNGEDVFNMSKGEQLRDYLPVESVAKQLLELCMNRAPGKYNVCSGTPISVRRLVEQRIKERESNIQLNLGYYPYPDYEPISFWGLQDIGETVFLPTLPNSPLRAKNPNEKLAPMRLRRNTALNFVENAAFDEDLIDYSADYANSQAHSKKFTKHMESVLALLKKQSKRGDLIVEVGCGDGDFLEMVKKDGFFNIKGYDASYEGNSPNIEKRYLSEGDNIEAELVVLRHVLEHIPNPFAFLSMLKTVFGNAKIYIEVPNYDWIVANQTFFDITYEHVNYFSQRSLIKLFKEQKATHGLLFEEQYQYVFADLEALNPGFIDLYESNQWNYVSFADLFPNLEKTIERWERVAQGRDVYIWGAATKGCLFLAHCLNTKKLIDKVMFAIDQNPKKIGRYLPGSCIQIKSKEEFFEFAKGNELLIVSNPAYKDEIVTELKAAGLNQVEIKAL